MKAKMIFFILLLAGQAIFAQMPDKSQALHTTSGSILGINGEPDIYPEVNLNSYEFLSTNLNFSEGNGLAKIVASPFKAIQFSGDGFKFSNWQSMLRETKISLAQRGGISTFGLGTGFDSGSPFGKRGEEKWDNWTPTHFFSPADSDTPRYKEAYATYMDGFKDQIGDYLRSLYVGSLKFTVGGNLSLFEVLSGDFIDLDSNSLNDTEFALKQWSLDGGAAYIPHEDLALGFGLHYGKARASSEAENQLVPFWGFSTSISYRLFKLNKDNFESTDAYRFDLFIPSILFGGAFEYKQCILSKDAPASTLCPDNIKLRYTLTPFIDFKLSSKNQFRIGMPIRYFNFQDLSSNESKSPIRIGPTIQYTLQLSRL